MIICYTGNIKLTQWYNITGNMKSKPSTINFKPLQASQYQFLYSHLPILSDKHLLSNNIKLLHFLGFIFFLLNFVFQIVGSHGTVLNNTEKSIILFAQLSQNFCPIIFQN